MRRAPLVLSWTGVLVTACGPGDAPPVEPTGDAPAPAAAAADDPDAPRFADFPVEAIFRGHAAPVDLASHPSAAARATELRAAAARGPDFAGHYTVASWSCGRGCRELLIVDARTGLVVDGLEAPSPVRYRLDSRLLVVEAAEPPPGRTLCSGCGASYFVLEGDRLMLLPPERWLGGGAPPAAVASQLDGWRAGEQELMGERAPAVARPSWNRLLLAPRNAPPVVLEDRVEGGDLAWAYVFRGEVAALDAWLVELIYSPEGGRFLLVDAGTGRMTTLDAPPVPSPDGRRFVTASWDLVAGHSPNRIRVYRMTPDGPDVEWSVEPRQWGGRSPRWLDSASVALERGVVDWSGTPLRTRWSPMRLERVGGGWRVAS